MTIELPIVAIHGVPRSGTSWLGQMFNSSPNVAYRYQPFFSHAFRGRVGGTSSAPELRRFFADLLESDDPFVMQAGSASLSRIRPVFGKVRPTTLVYKEVRFHDLLPHLLATVPEFSAIGIVRDPRAVIASWSRAPREFDPTWPLADEWRHATRKNAGLEENWYGFDRWKELAQHFMQLEHRHPERFCVVRYEDLVRDTPATLQGLFDFCHLDLGPQTRRFIEDSSTIDDDDPYGVYRAHDGLVPPRLDESIRIALETELRSTPLARFLVG